MSAQNDAFGTDMAMPATGLNAETWHSVTSADMEQKILRMCRCAECHQRASQCHGQCVALPQIGTGRVPR